MSLEKVAEMQREGAKYLSDLHAHLSKKHTVIGTQLLILQNLGDKPLILEVKEMDRGNFYLTSLLNTFNILHVKYDHIKFTENNGPEKLWAIIIAKDNETLGAGLDDFTAAVQDHGANVIDGTRRIV